MARSAVAEAGDRHLSEDGEQMPGVMAPAAEAHRPARVINHQGRAYVPVSPGVEMGLESQADQLSATALGLALDDLPVLAQRRDEPGPKGRDHGEDRGPDELLLDRKRAGHEREAQEEPFGVHLRQVEAGPEGFRSSMDPC